MEFTCRMLGGAFNCYSLRETPFFVGRTVPRRGISGFVSAIALRAGHHPLEQGDNRKTGPGK